MRAICGLARPRRVPHRLAGIVGRRSRLGSAPLPGSSHCYRRGCGRRRSSMILTNPRQASSYSWQRFRPQAYYPLRRQNDGLASVVARTQEEKLSTRSVRPPHRRAIARASRSQRRRPRRAPRFHPKTPCSPSPCAPRGQISRQPHLQEVVRYRRPLVAIVVVLEAAAHLHVPAEGVVHRHRRAPLAALANCRHPWRAAGPAARGCRCSVGARWVARRRPRRRRRWRLRALTRRGWGRGGRAREGLGREGTQPCARRHRLLPPCLRLGRPLHRSSCVLGDVFLESLSTSTLLRAEVGVGRPRRRSTLAVACRRRPRRWRRQLARRALLGLEEHDDAVNLDGAHAQAAHAVDSSADIHQLRLGERPCMS